MNFASPVCLPNFPIFQLQFGPIGSNWHLVACAFCFQRIQHNPRLHPLTLSVTNRNQRKVSVTKNSFFRHGPGPTTGHKNAPHDAFSRFLTVFDGKNKKIISTERRPIAFNRVQK
jgi:hypothetical protein